MSMFLYGISNPVSHTDLPTFTDPPEIKNSSWHTGIRAADRTCVSLSNIPTALDRDDWRCSTVTAVGAGRCVFRPPHIRCRGTCSGQSGLLGQLLQWCVLCYAKWECVLCSVFTIGVSWMCNTLKQTDDLWCVFALMRSFKVHFIRTCRKDNGIFTAQIKP